MTDDVFWGTGWAFPPSFQLDSRGVSLVSREQNINQAIDIILSTRKGERSVLPSFGSPLNDYLFRHMDATLVGEIAEAVRSSLLEYEPRIIVDDVNVDVAGGELQHIDIAISYTIRSTNSRHNHVFPFSFVEGTNLPGR